MAELNEKDEQEIIKQEQKAKRVNGFHVIVGMLIIMGFGILIDDGIINAGALTSNSTDNFWNLSGTSFLFPNNLNWKILFGSRADLNFNNLLKVEGDINVSGNLYVANQTLVNTWLYNQSISPATATWNRSGTNVFLNSLGDNVGIGRASQGNKLDILGTSATYPQLAVAVNDNTGKKHIGLYTANSVLQSQIWSQTSGSNLGLMIDTGDATMVNAMFISRVNQNVGIRTITPTALLDVAGTTILRNKMNLTGTTIRNTKDAISINVYANITMQSPNGNNATCGINNNFVFSCSQI